MEQRIERHMKKQQLLKHIQTYHDTKSDFRKKFPGDQNTYPRVSKEIAKVIEYLNLIPGDSLSDNEFSRLMVLISQDSDLSPKTKQTFKEMADGIVSHHKALETSAAAAVKIEKPATSTEMLGAVSDDVSEELDLDGVDVDEDDETAALTANKSPAREEEIQSELDEEEQDEEQQDEEQQDEEQQDEEQQDEEQQDHDEEVFLALKSEDEEKRDASKLFPPAPSSTPTPHPSPATGPLKRPISSDAIHALLTADNKNDVAAASGELLIPAVLSPTSGEHLIPSGFSTPASISVSSAAAKHKESKVEPSASTPLLSSTPSSSYTTPSRRPPSAPPYLINFKRAAAFGLTMGVIDFASSYSNDERLNYRALRALSVGFIYSVFSYNTENSSSLMLMASLFHSALNFYLNPPASLYNSASTLFGRALITSGTQVLWNRVIPGDPEPHSPSAPRAHR
jgi:hypothetical protein